MFYFRWILGALNRGRILIIEPPVLVFDGPENVRFLF